MIWFLIEIGVALALFGVLMWWTVRSLRRRDAEPAEPDAAARDRDEV